METVTTRKEEIESLQSEVKALKLEMEECLKITTSKPLKHSRAIVHVLYTAAESPFTPEYTHDDNGRERFSSRNH